MASNSLPDREATNSDMAHHNAGMTGKVAVCRMKEQTMGCISIDAPDHAIEKAKGISEVPS